MPPRGSKASKFCVISGSRSDYDLLRPVMLEVQASGLKLAVVAAGMHLSNQFGRTSEIIEADGFTIDACVDMTFMGDSNGAMGKSIGVGIYGMTQAIEQIDPDVVLVLGDRVEAFAGAVSAAALNKVVAHIHGGDTSKGGLDDSMRHATTKFAHVHFAATEASRHRLIRMGERPDRVYTVGAPGIDALLSAKLYSLQELEVRLGFPLKRPFIIALQHPISTDADAASLQMKETMKALGELKLQTILIYPNADAGGRRMLEVIEADRGQPWLHIFKSLSHDLYVSLLANAEMLLGNSSSGIIEAPSFHLPVVNIGPRQNGRERSTNVIDVAHDRNAIKHAIERVFLDEEFRSCAKMCTNPYGDGTASRRIVQVLKSLEIRYELIQKQLTY